MCFTHFHSLSQSLFLPFNEFALSLCFVSHLNDGALGMMSVLEAHAFTFVFFLPRQQTNISSSSFLSDVLCLCAYFYINWVLLHRHTRTLAHALAFNSIGLICLCACVFIPFSKQAKKGKTHLDGIGLDQDGSEWVKLRNIFGPLNIFVWRFGNAREKIYINVLFSKTTETRRWRAIGLNNRHKQ